MTPIERLPNRFEFNEAEEAFLAGFCRKRSLRKNNYRRFRRKNLIEEAIDPTSGFEILRQVMALRRRPVCLACGSSDVSTMPIPYDHDMASEESVPTGTIHPGCGGELLLRCSGGLRIAVTIFKNVYDVQGRFVECSRKSLAANAKAGTGHIISHQQVVPIAAIDEVQVNSGALFPVPRKEALKAKPVTTAAGRAMAG